MNARTLMVQGCTSDAGKSTLVAALCRWLVRRGARVAPFKPQNMALNSAVAADGSDGFGEIGRAQAAQAAACRIAPTTDMNPVLLKPTTDVGAQVIIHGHAIGNMAALDYHAYKSTARSAVLESFDRLCAAYEDVIIEGAGSPAEINLREGDIANMGFAEAVDCPVILVADIDRGGVFAHLVGTLALLSESEQARVKGFVINRFRGDLALLQPGLDWLEARTGKPVLGVLPYLHGLALEAEDAIARDEDKSSFPRKRESTCPTNPSSPQRRGPSDFQDQDQSLVSRLRGNDGKRLRIIAPVLPRISNHTDFDALRSHPQVDFRFTGPDESIPAADLIVLPGSKAVRADLDFLRAQGWEAAIARHLRYGGKLIGICGGFQMLGHSIADPLGLEGEPGSAAGLGYLDMHTTLAAEKQLRQVEGQLTLGDAPVRGYEIHAGISEGPALARPALHVARMQAAGQNPGTALTQAPATDSATLHPGYRPDGAISADDQILGTYLHGLFDSPAACDASLAWAGLRDARSPDIAAQREASLERLADMVDAHLDTARLLAIMEGA